MTNKYFVFENGHRIKKPKLDIVCKQKIRIGHQKYITVAIKTTFLNSDFKMQSIDPLHMYVNFIVLTRVKKTAG